MIQALTKRCRVVLAQSLPIVRGVRQRQFPGGLARGDRIDRDRE